MRPKKGTKAYNSEYVYVLYGLHSERLTVESVWQQRDGTLSGATGYKHYVLPGRRAEHEAALVFHLTDIRTIPVNLLESLRPRIEAELEALAIERRKEKEAKELPE